MIRQTSAPAALLGALMVATMGTLGVAAARQLSAQDRPTPSAEPYAEAATDQVGSTAQLEGTAAGGDADSPTGERHRGSSGPVVAEPTPDPREWMQHVGRADRIFLGVSTPSDATDEVDAFAAAAGRVPEVVMISRDFASGGFDLATAERLVESGHVPLVAWEPWHHEHALPGQLRAVQPAFALSTIFEGAHDEVLRTWARDVADFRHPVFIRFAHEMNGFWYPWAESTNGNRPGDFVRAWHHVHGVFADEGATNVRWVWSPNLSQPTLTPLAQLWPGDDYVDYVGLVGYLGNGIDPTVWVPTFDELFTPTIDEVREFTGLPIIITEIGATEQGGRKAEWITDVTAAVEGRDDIVGLVWFEIDKESDWRIASSPEATAAFAAGVANDERWGVPRN